LRDAESKYHNNFSQSPLVFPEIEGVNAESDCFDILGRTTLRLLGSQFMKKKSKIGTKELDSKSPISNDCFCRFFNKNIYKYNTEKTAILKVYFRKSLISQLLLRIFQKKLQRR
jgi:hypothetical protein